MATLCIFNSTLATNSTFLKAQAGHIRNLLGNDCVGMHPNFDARWQGLAAMSSLLTRRSHIQVGQDLGGEGGVL
jgi:hypothetical protein